MTVRLSLRLSLAVVGALTLFGGVADACSLPVFRVALLDRRWRPEPFEFYLFHKGPLPAAEKEILSRFNDYLDKNEGHVNCVLQVIDLDKNPDKELAELFEAAYDEHSRRLAKLYNLETKPSHRSP